MVFRKDVPDDTESHSRGPKGSGLYFFSTPSQDSVDDKLKNNDKNKNEESTEWNEQGEGAETPNMRSSRLLLRGFRDSSLPKEEKGLASMTRSRAARRKRGLLRPVGLPVSFCQRKEGATCRTHICLNQYIWGRNSMMSVKVEPISS